MAGAAAGSIAESGIRSATLPALHLEAQTEGGGQASARDSSAAARDASSPPVRAMAAAAAARRCLLLLLAAALPTLLRGDGGRWSDEEVQQLLASDGAGGDRFGYSVALSGDVALIGAYYHVNAGGTRAGAVYVFTWEAGGGDGGGGGAPGAWVETQQLLASDGPRLDYFGISVALSGDVALIGAYGVVNAGGFNAGAVYVFTPCSSIDIDSLLSGMCCHDFSSVVSVEAGSCTSCTGDLAADCTNATCASGFHSYSDTECRECADFSSVASVETGSCTSCTGDLASDCTEATCASGFSGFMASGICCHDFSSVASVEAGSCTSCTAPAAML